MLDTVDAVSYKKTMSTGRNCPVLLEVERANGSVVDAVVKLASAECGPGGLVREAMASMLASDLGMPVAEPFVVRFSEAFLASIPDLSVRSRFDVDVPAFGCVYAQGMSPILETTTLTNAAREMAARTFAFDAAILNQDRRVAKANCLTNGTELLLIDHELSLNVYGRGGLLNPNPWENKALTAMTLGHAEHVFYRRVRHEKLDVKTMLESLSTISATRVKEYANAVPPEWDGSDIVSGIADYILDLIAHASELHAQVDEVLA